jgi:hypothetical protein
MTNAENVEIVALGDFDPDTKRRDFDALSYGRYYWRGRLDFVLWDQPEEGRIYVFSDRSDVLGDDYGMRPGTIEEVENEVRARQVIAKAVEQCFDHTTTLETISDGKGGWITLETDT